MMQAVRAPQSNPPTTACWILRASINARMSAANAPCWPLRGVSLTESASCRSRAGTE